MRYNDLVDEENRCLANVLVKQRHSSFPRKYISVIGVRVSLYLWMEIKISSGGDEGGVFYKDSGCVDKRLHAFMIGWFGVNCTVVGPFRADVQPYFAA